jgi:polysaccharide export outer membrane protein
MWGTVMRMRPALMMIAVAICAGLSACASDVPKGVRDVTNAPTAGALPPPDPVQAATNLQQNYRIGPRDVLAISVFRVETLQQEQVQVDLAGQINFPLIGTVTAAARTPNELAAEIAAKLEEKYLQDPQVTVLVKDAVSQRFTVEGAVRKPGIFPLVGKTTLLQAIATAVGLDDVGNSRAVVVFRTVNQRRMATAVDLAEVRTGKLGDPDIHPGDVIVVATSKSRRAIKDIVGLSPLTSFRLLFGGY